MPKGVYVHSKKTPKPFCLRGHEISIVGRYANGDCRECKREKVKKYYNNNVENILSLKNKYRISHEKEIKQWRDDHKDYFVQYDKNHPDIRRLCNLRAHIKRGLRIVAWGQEGTLEFLLAKPEEMVLDHIIPLCGKKVSGLHVIWNLQYLPPKQNSSKRNKCNLLETSKWYGKILEEAGLK
jgi:hypothetical protein